MIRMRRVDLERCNVSSRKRRAATCEALHGYCFIMEVLYRVFFSVIVVALRCLSYGYYSVMMVFY